MDVVRCLDTYALIEIYKGNPKFSGHLKKKFIITDITLAEFYSVLLREENEETANYWAKKFEAYSIPISRDMILEAVRFRRKHNNTNISFFDAVGYIFSLRNGFYFVTGDKEFKKFKNVEFVKK